MGGTDRSASQGPSGSAPDVAHLESLVNAVGGVVWEFDWSTGAFTFVSDAARDLLGYPLEDWYEPGFWAGRLHPDDAEWAIEYCKSCTRNRSDHEFEYRMFDADGRVVWVRDIVTVDAEKGMDGCLRGLLVDITARKSAEERLASSELRFREIVENVGLLAVHLDAAGSIVFANPPVERLVGGSVVGRTFFDLLEGESRAGALAAFEDRIVSGGGDGQFETPLRAADGLTHVVRWHSANVYGPRGAFAGVVSIGQDVTEHVAHERELAHKAEEFDAIFRLSRDLFFRVNPDGRVVGYAAPAHDKLYAPPEAFMNRRYRDVLPPDAAATLTAGAAQCHETGDVVIAEYQLALGDQARDWEARFLPLEGGDTAVIVRDVTIRNAQEAQLQESEERYRTLVELAPEAIFVVSLDDIVLYCNEAAARLIGAPSAHALTGRSIAHILPADYVKEAWEDEKRIARAVAQMQPGDPVPISPPMRASTLTLDGRSIDIERSIAGIHYRGQPALLTVTRDITQELEVERAITESRDFLAKLLEMLDSGVIVVDGVRRVITRANRPAEELLGYDHDELLGVSTRQLHVSDASFRDFNQRMADSLDAGELQAVEVPLVRKDGIEFDAEVSVRSVTGAPGGQRIGTIRDISQRKAAENMLRDSEQRLRAIVDEAPFGMHFYRLDGEALIYTGCNPAADRMLGVDMSASEGRPIEQAFPALADTEVPAAYRGIARDGGTWRTEDIAYDQDGIVGAYEVTAFQMQPGRVAVVFQDITDRKVAEERERTYVRRLSALAADLADAEDAERRRLAESLHDRVGQALAVAVMHLRAAEAPPDGACNTAELRRGYDFLEEAIRETRTLTTELFPPVLHELGLGPALHWLCDEISREHGVRCVATVEEPVDRQLAPEARTVIFRAVRELLMNVVKHAEAAHASITFSGDERSAEIIVEDDGIGFDVERVTAGGASGFGLFSIRERLPHMGGEVEIDSAPGRGTRATLRIPWVAE